VNAKERFNSNAAHNPQGLYDSSLLVSIVW